MKLFKHKRIPFCLFKFKWVRSYCYRHSTKSKTNCYCSWMYYEWYMFQSGVYSRLYLQGMYVRLRFAIGFVLSVQVSLCVFVRLFLYVCKSRRCDDIVQIFHVARLKLWQEATHTRHRIKAKQKPSPLPLLRPSPSPSSSLHHQQ